MLADLRRRPLRLALLAGELVGNRPRNRWQVGVGREGLLLPPGGRNAVAALDTDHMAERPLHAPLSPPPGSASQIASGSGRSRPCRSQRAAVAGAMISAVAPRSAPAARSFA